MNVTFFRLNGFLMMCRSSGCAICGHPGFSFCMSVPAPSKPFFSQAETCHIPFINQKPYEKKEFNPVSTVLRADVGRRMDRLPCLPSRRHLRPACLRELRFDLLRSSLHFRGCLVWWSRHHPACLSPVRSCRCRPCPFPPTERGMRSLFPAALRLPPVGEGGIGKRMKFFGKYHP